MIIHSFQKSPSSEVTVQLPVDLQKQVKEVANQQGDSISEIICLALELYIKKYFNKQERGKEKLNLVQARNLMRNFGKGLGSGSLPHNTARNHDGYLYEKIVLSK